MVTSSEFFWLVKGAATSGTKSIKLKAIVYTDIKISIIFQAPEVNKKTYIHHGFKTSQNLCNRGPDQRKVVQNPGFPNQDV